MLFLVILLGIIAGLVVWHFYVENVANMDVKIPPSSNLTFNNETPSAINATDLANDFEKYDSKPVLLYIYTTWCGVCKKNFPIINEIAREFQNSELHFIAISIDRDIDAITLQNQLNQYGNLYFKAQFLASKIGFIEFLRQKNVSYNGRIPYTVLFNRNGEVITKYSGSKSLNYLRRQIIKELYL